MEILVASPTVSTTTNTATSTATKRKITPSPESVGSRKVTIVSPPGLIPEGNQVRITDFPHFSPSWRLFPGGYGNLERRETVDASHAHPETGPVPPWRLPPSHDARPDSREIILPFDLHMNPSAFSRKDNFLWDVFPDTIAIFFQRNILTYQLLTPPLQPWPLKIAGVPCYITTDLNDLGPMPPIHHFSRSRIRLAEESNFRDKERQFSESFEVIKAYFTESQISITEIQYWGNFFTVVLEDQHSDLTKVPKSVGKYPCYYVYENETCRPRNLSSFRFKSATQDVPDNSSYETLRPGVMVGSEKLPGVDAEMLTTSGALVRDQIGNTYMTVASHGFPDGSSVYHPHVGGQAIGELIMEVPNTDISLVKLRPGLQFVNEPFQNSIVAGPPFPLRDFVRSCDMKPGDPVFMDSPFTGYMEGIRGPESKIRVSQDNPLEPEQVWISCRWDYMGQGSHRNMADDGVCGSAIWNENGQVAGFFLYAPNSGYFLDHALCVTADELIDKGYSVVQSGTE